MENFFIKNHILRFISFIVFVFPFPQLNAQKIDFNHYQNIECGGEIPKVITKNIEKRIAEEGKKEIDKQDNWRDKKNKEKFIVESSYSISELLISGAVLFNDTISNYITDVAKELLKNDLETFSKLHFFVIKSPYVNAFSTNEGIVLINMGLIAQLETEAQLAFILAHEIAHFQKKHVINLYVEERTNNNVNVFNRTRNQDELLKNINFSKEFETEADEVGLEIFLKSNYSTASLKGVFDILQFSYLPIDEIPFDPIFFNSPHLNIPSSYFLKKVNDIKIHGEFSSTHPNISSRRDNILTRTAYANNAGKKEFLYSLNQFENVRDIARFELTSIYTADRKYEAAIYNSYVLLNKYPNSEFLHCSIGNALYFLSKYANIGILSDVTSSYANVEGESQQVHYFIQSLKKADLNVITCEYLWRCFLKFPSRNDIKKKGNEILNELIRLHYPTENAFAFEEEIKIPELPALNSENDSKYDKIRSKLEKDTPPKKENIDTKYAFVDLFKNSEFKEEFLNAYKNKDLNVTISKSYYTSTLTQYNVKTTENLGINKIVMLDPNYYKIDDVFDNKKFDPVSSNKAQIKYSSMIKSIAKKARLDVVLLDSKFLNTKQVNIFNEITRLNAFVDEMYIHRNLDSMLTTDYQLTQLLLQKHNTRYLAWNNIFAVTEADAMADPYTLAMYSYYLFPLIPFFIYDALTPDHYIYHNMMLADIEKGKIIYNHSYRISGKDTDDRLKSNLYYNFLQIKGKDKKKGAK